MRTLESFKDALRVFGESCEDEFCQELWGDGVYRYTRKGDDGKIIFVCSRNCESEYEMGFELTPVIREELEQGVITLFSKRPPKDASRLQFNDFFSQSNGLMRKLNLYALMHNPEDEEELKGYCENCFSQVPMMIRDRGLWIACELCASIIADSAY